MMIKLVTYNTFLVDVEPNGISTIESAVARQSESLFSFIAKALASAIARLSSSEY